MLFSRKRAFRVTGTSVVPTSSSENTASHSLLIIDSETTSHLDNPDVSANQTHGVSPPSFLVEMTTYKPNQPPVTINVAAHHEIAVAAAPILLVADQPVARNDPLILDLSHVPSFDGDGLSGCVNIIHY